MRPDRPSVLTSTPQGGNVLIGKINDRTRQKILVTIKQVKDARLIDLRVHQTNEDGEMIATPSGVSLTLEQAEQAIELLKEARKKIEAQPR
jgi:hypothetical protein